jgi:hypothetical protein
MAIVGLLVVALALLVVGLILANPVVLIASLLVSVVAGVVVFRTPRQVAPQATTTDQVAAAAEEVDEAVPEPEHDVWVIDGRPRFHRADCEMLASHEREAIPRSQALEDGFLACSLCVP